MTRQRVKVAGWALILAAWGCANKSSSVDAGPACAALAAARCQQLQVCSPNGFQATYGGDAGFCASAVTATCIQNLVVPGNMNSPALTFQCAQDLANETCRDYFLNNPPASCIPPAGHLDGGAACGVSGQCATQLCQTPRSSLCGACEPQPMLGAPCLLTGCGIGLVCDPDGGTCILPTYTSGASCTDSAQCGVGYACIVAAPGATGTCRPETTRVDAGCNLADGGSPCNPVLNLFCDTRGAYTCRPYTWAQPGAPCGYLDAGVYASCANSGSCGEVDAGIGTCLAPAVSGAPCDTSLGPSCLPPLKCVWTSAAGTAGTCQPLDPSSCR